MKIEYHPTKFMIQITDEEMSQWRDGKDVFFKLPKDGNGKERQRPEWNLYEHEGFNDSDQALYRLDRIAHGYPVNKCPQNIVDVLENAEKISKIYHKYMRHALAVCLDPEGKLLDNKEMI